MLSQTNMIFLAEEHDLDDVGWDNPAIALLWRYNLHYFDDLNASGAAERRDWHCALLRRWLAENPPPRGTAFAPYPTSLRIVNWVKWFLAGTAPEACWLDSLALQARLLARRVEWHLLGNHLFANAKALVFAGLYFDSPEASSWLVKGLKILERELREQVLADGGQFERSPMYHALALEDLLDLINIVNALAPKLPETRDVANALRRCAGPMLFWLRAMTHPGGALVRFNDCAEGVAPPNEDIEHYAAALGVTAARPDVAGVVHFKHSGYIRVCRARATAWLDVAAIGPDYLPGHAHADTLSFELSVGAHELIVNRGTSVYGDGPRRLLERGTSSHSTVQIGSGDSSEVWSGFRVGRRARPGPVLIDDWCVKGSHDGYTHLTGRPRHYRCWRFEPEALTVHDRLEPETPLPAAARYHLAPGLTLQAETPARWRVHHRERLLAYVEVQTGTGRVEHWQHAASFGLLVSAQTLCVSLERCQARVRWSWDLECTSSS
jgi:uncharacterized heparinase superfamily protein